MLAQSQPQLQLPSPPHSVVREDTKPDAGGNWFIPSVSAGAKVLME